MQYQDENGQLHIRPLQDINARWTMGRLSRGFRKLLQSRESQSGCMDRRTSWEKVDASGSLHPARL